MKRILAGVLSFLVVSAALITVLPRSAFADLPGAKYYVMWSFGTPGEYYLDPQRYAAGEIPKVPEGITPTKEDADRIFHFIGWDRAPEPVEKDTVYYAVYRVAEKKYAMDFDTMVNIADVTRLLLHLSDTEGTNTLSSPDINADKTVSIKDVTALLFYLEKGEQPEISGKTLIDESTTG